MKKLFTILFLLLTLSTFFVFASKEQSMNVSLDVDTKFSAGWLDMEGFGKYHDLEEFKPLEDTAKDVIFKLGGFNYTAVYACVFTNKPSQTRITVDATPLTCVSDGVPKTEENCIYYQISDGEVLTHITTQPIENGLTKTTEGSGLRFQYLVVALSADKASLDRATEGTYTGTLVMTITDV